VEAIDLRAMLRCLVAALLVESSSGLRPQPGLLRPALPLTTHALMAGKGFGSKKASPPNPPAAGSGRRKKSAAAVASPMALAEEVLAESQDLEAMEARGRAALEKMRAEAGQKPVKVRRASEQLTPEELEPVDPSAGVMPEAVSNRMLGRILPFTAIPIFGTAIVFGAFYYANTVLELDLPPQIVATVTQGLLLLSFAGITWGVMSTSLDEEEEGSLLGAEQVKKNFDILRGTDETRRETAKAEFFEADAADDGVMMSRAALEKAEKRKKRKVERGD